MVATTLLKQEKKLFAAVPGVTVLNDVVLLFA
jgi:hypothetical protein